MRLRINILVYDTGAILFTPTKFDLGLIRSGQFGQARVAVRLEPDAVSGEWILPPGFSVEEAIKPSPHEEIYTLRLNPEFQFVGKGLVSFPSGFLVYKQGNRHESRLPFYFTYIKR